MEYYENKYKETLERAREQLEGAKVFDYKDEQIAHDIRTTIYEIFPELKESEDENIRKELLNHLKEASYGKTLVVSTLDYKRWADWLEKQGEQKAISQEYADAFDEFMSHIPEKDPEFSESCYNYDDMLSAIQFGIKWQQQHNSIVKVEQNPDGWNKEDERIYQSIIDDTVQENQLGDEQIDWLKSLKNRIIPQPKQKENEKDKEMFASIEEIMLDTESENGWNCVYLPDNDKEVLYSDIRNWLKSLKDRVQPQPKQEWSEEDKTVLNNLIYALENDKIGNNRDEYIDWLKSLRLQNRWKPSNEQMNLLEELVEDNNQRHFYTILRSLYEQLKKLRVE